MAGTPNRFVLEKHTRYVYATADSAFIRRVDFLENIHLQGFMIKSNQDMTVSHSFCRLECCANVHMRDIKFKDWSVWQGGGFHECFVTTLVTNSLIDDCEFEQSPERGHAAGSDPSNMVGYAMSCRSGCETVYYTNCRFKGMIRHCFTTTSNTATGLQVGVPGNIWLVNCRRGDKHRGFV